MSQHAPLAPDHPHTSAPTGQEPEHIDMARSVGILSASLFAFFIVVAWATVILHFDLAKFREGRAPSNSIQNLGDIPPEIGRAEIGIVNQKPFELDQRAERDAMLRRHELESYGWVDPKAGIVRVPIEEAMKSLLAEQNK